MRAQVPGPTRMILIVRQVTWISFKDEVGKPEIRTALWTETQTGSDRMKEWYYDYLVELTNLNVNGLAWDRTQRRAFEAVEGALVRQQRIISCPTGKL